MTKLGIQLSRHGHQTTRRPRWVVSLVAGLVGVILVLWLTGFYFSRSQLLKTVPTDTYAVIELDVHSRTTQKILELFDQVPLISGRTLEFHDLLPFIHGKAAFFLLTDGSTAFSMKTSKQELPQDLFDAHRIVVQEAAPGTILLSERLLPLSTKKGSFSVRRLMPDLLGQTIGRVVVGNGEMAGVLKMTDDTLFLKLGGFRLKQLDRSLPPETVGFLSTQMSKNVMTSLLQAFLGSEIIIQILDERSWLFLTKHDGKNGFVIWSPTPNDFTRESFLKEIITLLSPSLQKHVLQDGTAIEEILLDPDATSIEEVTVLGNPFFHAKLQKGEEFFMSKEGEMVFSNNETNLKAFLDGNTSSLNQYCHGNVAGGDLEAVTEIEKGAVDYYSMSLLRILSRKYRFFGVKSSGNNVSVTLCR